MNGRLKSVIVVALALAVSAAVHAETPAEAAFARLKLLEGTWVGPAKDADQVLASTVTYRLTGMGSALMETQGPGSPYEMVTLYHLDGKNLILTHYCGAHNQPTLLLQPMKSPNVLLFDFIRGSNMKPTDSHMHRLQMTFVDADHLISEWTNYSNGKPDGTMRFEMHRQKPHASKGVAGAVGHRDLVKPIR